MKRRTVLATMGVGAAGLAGCFTGGGDDSVDTPEGDPGTEVAVATLEGDAAEFEVESPTVPPNAEVDQPYVIEVTVNNVGDQAGVYRTEVERRVGASAAYKTAAILEVYVEAGKSETATVTLPPLESLQDASIRIKNTNYQWNVDVVGPELPMGAKFQADDLDIIYEFDGFTDLIDRPESCYQEASPGEKIALATVHIRNETNEGVWMAETRHYKLKYQNKVKNMTRCSTYSVGKLDQQETYTATVAFKVDEGTQPEDLTFWYDAQRDDKEAFWSPRWGSVQSEIRPQDTGQDQSDE
jgi:hypothetical protein